MRGRVKWGGGVRDKGAWIAAWIVASGVRCVKLLEMGLRVIFFV